MATVLVKGRSMLNVLMKSMSFPSAATSDGHHWFFPTPFIAIASSATLAITETAHACDAAIAQLGERQTEDLKVSSSILGLGMFPPAPAPRVGLGGRDFSFRA